MFFNAGVDCILLLYKYQKFKLKKRQKLVTSLHMNKLSFLSPTLNPGFLPSNYLYLVYTATK